MPIYATGEQKAQWKGKIEYENGVKLIKNPKELLYGEIEFELEKDLSIGRVIKKGFIYTYKTSKESGYIRVKRYKIKNWEMIREGI